MEQLEGILKIVDNELEAINKNGKFRSKEEIDSVYKLIDSAKDIYCIWEYEEGMMGEDEMSFAGGGSYARGERGGRSYRGGSYEGGSYEGGGSYARGGRGRGRNARRDSMGRYSREGGSGYSRAGYERRYYSRDDGKEEFVDGLREMMQEAPNDQARQEIQRMIQQMEQE